MRRVGSIARACVLLALLAAGSAVPGLHVVAGTSPETTITSGPPAFTNSTSVRLTFVSDVADAKFDCALDKLQFGPCSSPLDLFQLSEGRHEFAVRARVPGGAEDPSPATVTFTVDAQAPTVLVTLAPMSGPNVRPDEVTIEFAVSDALSGVEQVTCAFDGKSVDLCISPLTLRQVAPGPHIFVITAVDRAGNATTSKTAFALPTPAERISGLIGAVRDLGLRPRMIEGSLVRVLERAREELARGRIDRACLWLRSFERQLRAYEPGFISPEEARPLRDEIALIRRAVGCADPPRRGA